jgi:hypothetical protein
VDIFANLHKQVAFAFAFALAFADSFAVRPKAKMLLIIFVVKLYSFLVTLVA